MKPSAKSINQIMNDIKEELDIVTPTERHMIQQTFSDIIIPYGERGSGTVLTYGQAVSRKKTFAAKYGQEYQEYTQQQYQKDVRNLVKAIGEKNSVEGAKQAYIDGARELIDNYNEWSGGTIDIDSLDFEILKDVINKASDEMGARSKDRNDSAKLFMYMRKYFEEYGIRAAGIFTDD